MKLDIDQIRAMSLDQIIQLYREGYSIEDTNNIRNLAYPDNCSGTPALDKSDTTITSGYDHPVPLLLAVAQKFKPTSRCLKSVTVKLQRILNNDAYIEIRRTTTNGDKLPNGDPQSSGGRIAYATIPYSSIPTAGGEVIVDINAVLDDFDLTNGVWIVLSMYSYDPSCGGTYCSDPSFTINGGPSFNADQYVARKSGTNPWTKFNANIYFKTSKQTYTAPVLTTITVTPATATVGLNNGDAITLTATARDQYGAVMQGVLINWTLETTVSAGLLPSSGTTDAQGQTTTSFGSGSLEGTATVTASNGAVSGESIITMSATPPPVQAGFGAAGMVLIAGLAVGAIYMATRPKVSSKIRQI